MALEIGSGQFIPGFEDQLIGAKAGDDVAVKVSFPADYGVAELAGKPAEFATKVTRAPCATNAWAQAKPMPWLPPVIKTCSPLSPKSIRFSLW